MALFLTTKASHGLCSLSSARFLLKGPHSKACPSGWRKNGMKLWLQPCGGGSHRQRKISQILKKGIVPSSWAWKSSQTFWVQFISPHHLQLPAPAAAEFALRAFEFIPCLFLSEIQYWTQGCSGEGWKWRFEPSRCPLLPSEVLLSAPGMNCGKVRICFCLGDSPGWNRSPN